MKVTVGKSHQVNLLQCKFLYFAARRLILRPNTAWANVVQMRAAGNKILSLLSWEHQGVGVLMSRFGEWDPTIPLFDTT